MKVNTNKMKVQKVIVIKLKNLQGLNYSIVSKEQKIH